MKEEHSKFLLESRVSNVPYMLWNWSPNPPHKKPWLNCLTPLHALIIHHTLIIHLTCITLIALCVHLFLPGIVIFYFFHVIEIQSLLVVLIQISSFEVCLSVCLPICLLWCFSRAPLPVNSMLLWMFMIPFWIVFLYLTFLDVTNSSPII